MTKDEIQAWLDKHIDLTNQILDNKYLEDNEILGLFHAEDRVIHLYTDVLKIGELLGETTYIDERNDNSFPFIAYFFYRSYKVFELLKEIPKETEG